jgi:hypothetical protein
MAKKKTQRRGSTMRKLTTTALEPVKEQPETKLDLNKVTEAHESNNSVSDQTPVAKTPSANDKTPK